MTTMMQKLRDRLAAKRTDTTTTYWNAVEKVARGNLSEKALLGVLEAIEGAMTALGKIPSDVEIDAALLCDLQELKDAEQRHAQAKIDLRVVFERARQTEVEAARLEAQIKAMREGSANEVRERKHEVTTAKAGVTRLHEVRARLDAAGHPGSKGEVAAVEQQREVDRVEADLRVVERDLAEAEAAAATFTGNEDHAEARAGHRVVGAAAALRQNRDAMRQRLVEIRNGELATSANTVTPVRDGLDVEVLP